MQIENKQLKEFILDANLLDSKVLEESFKEADKNNQRLGDLLLEKKLIDEVELRKMYSYILGIPFVNLEKESITSDILQIIPEPIAKKYNIIAFEKEGKTLRVAMKNPEDLQTIDFIRKKTGLKIVPCLTSDESIKAVLKQYEKSLKAEFGDIINKDSDAVTTGENAADLQQFFPDLQHFLLMLQHLNLYL